MFTKRLERRRAGKLPDDTKITWYTSLHCVVPASITPSAPLCLTTSIFTLRREFVRHLFTQTGFLADNHRQLKMRYYALSVPSYSNLRSCSTICCCLSLATLYVPRHEILSADARPAARYQAPTLVLRGVPAKRARRL